MDKKAIKRIKDKAKSAAVSKRLNKVARKNKRQKGRK